MLYIHGNLEVPTILRWDGEDRYTAYRERYPYIIADFIRRALSGELIWR